MKFSTIVNKSEDGINQISSAIQQFNEDGFLEGISERRYTQYDILQMIELVRECHSKLRREILALSEFAKTFNITYATDHNQCFETASRLFWKLRSSISGTKKVFKKLCPIIRSKKTLAEGQPTPSAFERVRFLNGNYTYDIFGMEGTADCVKVLYHEIGEFFIELLIGMNLCLVVLRDERLIKMDPVKCRKLYMDYYAKIHDDVKKCSRMMSIGNNPVKVQSDISDMKKKMTLNEFFMYYFHNATPSEMWTHVTKEVYEEDMKVGMTDEERSVFPNGADRIVNIRLVLEHFDELDELKGRGNKINAEAVAMFMYWSKPAKEELFVNYFANNYQGKYETVRLSAVNTAKSKALKDSTTTEKWINRFLELIAKYSKTEDLPLKAS